MYKKILLTILVFLIPIAFLEQNKPERAFLFSNKKGNQSKKQYFYSSEKFSNKINNCGGKEDLESKNKYCSSVNKKFLKNYNI